MAGADGLCRPWEHRTSRARPVPRGRGAAAGMIGLGALESAALAGAIRERQKQVLFVWLDGGMSQLESWDPKPGTLFGGPFRSIPTSVPGISVSELLPRCAVQMHRLAIVRSLCTKDNSHSAGVARIQRGDPKNRGAAYPFLGSAVARLLGPGESGLPRTSGSPGNGGFMPQDAGFLGHNTGRSRSGTVSHRRTCCCTRRSADPTTTPAMLSAVEPTCATPAGAARSPPRPAGSSSTWPSSCDDEWTCSTRPRSRPVTWTAMAVRPRPAPAPGAAPDRGRRHVREGDQLPLGHARRQLQPEPVPGPAVRPALCGAGGGFVRQRAERACAGDRDERVRPHAAHQRARRPRPLARGVERGDGRLRIRRGQVVGATDAKGTTVATEELDIGHMFHTWFRALGIDPATTEYDNHGQPLPIAHEGCHAVEPLLT
ncbi:MAG: DUF1501 domain-containing protein [Singulisphaera sp.]